MLHDLITMNNYHYHNNKNNNNGSCYSTERTIENLLFYRKRIHKNSTSSNILQLLYPDKSHTIKQIASQLDNNNKSYHYTKKIILTLHSNGYLDDDSKSYGKSYHLSQVGRWFAICVQLDNISFQSLCILAEAYTKIKRHPRRYYLISKFRNYFDESYDKERNCASAIYSSSNILKSIKQLEERNLAYWTFRGILKINSKTFEMLCKKYDEELESLAIWNNKIFDKCKDHYINNFSLEKKRPVIRLTAVGK